jgi:hypothetical protein
VVLEERLYGISSTGLEMFWLRDNIHDPRPVYQGLYICQQCIVVRRRCGIPDWWLSWLMLRYRIAFLNGERSSLGYNSYTWVPLTSGADLSLSECFTTVKKRVLTQLGFFTVNGPTT